MIPLQEHFAVRIEKVVSSIPHAGAPEPRIAFEGDQGASANVGDCAQVGFGEIRLVARLTEDYPLLTVVPYTRAVQGLEHNLRPRRLRVLQCAV